MGHLRRKLENDAAQPKHLVTETAGVAGSRLGSAASACTNALSDRRSHAGACRYVINFFLDVRQPNPPTLFAFLNFTVDDPTPASPSSRSGPVDTRGVISMDFAVGPECDAGLQ
jgi:hypothetical protein